MKEFNLNEYLKNPSQKVVTRDGKSVRIICTDAKQDYPVIGLLSLDDKRETTVYYKKNGRWLADNQDYWDLFFAPIKREGWVNIYKDNITTFTSSHIHTTEKQAQEEALESLKEYGKFIATVKIEWEE